MSIQRNSLGRFMNPWEIPAEAVICSRPKRVCAPVPARVFPLDIRIRAKRDHQLYKSVNGARPNKLDQFGGIPLGFGRLGVNPGYKGTMHIQSRYILTIATLAFALASVLPNKVSADELKQAKVTQVIQDVRVLPSNASPRPATVNDDVHQGTAVQTGVQSRSELTFKDQTITRLGEKTIFSVGQGARTIDLGSGQFLLYAPKKAGGAKVKMGPVTAAISG